MKFRFFSIVALVGVLLSSCAVDELPAEGGSINAEMETDQTRTAVTDEGTFTWSAGDKVWLHTTTGSVLGTLSSGAGSSSAKFTYGDFVGEMTGKAVYPYNDGHSVSGEVLNFVLPASYDLGSSLTNTNAAMYGVDVGGTIRFNHLAGVMRFKFKDVPAGVNKFTITLDKKINGTFTADLTADYPVIETSAASTVSEKTITLNFNALTEKSDISVYVPLPIGTYNSLELGLYNGSQSVWTYSKSVTNTVNRKSLKLMPTVTMSGSMGGDIEGGESSNPDIEFCDYIDEYGINHGQGIKIAEIIWAPVNCGYHIDDYKYGKIYQWGRKYGQGYNGNVYDVNGTKLGTSDELVPEFENAVVSSVVGNHEDKSNVVFINPRGDSYDDWVYPQDDMLWNSGTESSPVKTIYDPCPDGWRVPTWQELEELSGNHSSWATDNLGRPGCYFSGPYSYSSGVSQVFLPATGDRGDDGSSYARGNRGCYWSSSICGNDAIWFCLHIRSESIYTSNTYRIAGNAVRCVQEGSRASVPVDLSDNGFYTANCYIVSRAGAYKFTPRKGNSSESVGSIASAEVLWESFGTDVTPNVGDLVTNVKYEDDVIFFETPSPYKEGNAVIAAKDASGEILWSWHIWLTDQPEGQVYFNNAGTMMDRNLGATSATPGDVGALGLLYQWGRKDPFLGSSSIHYDSMTEANSTINWPSAVSSNSSNGTIAYATANPTTFITYNISNFDWYYTGSSSIDNTRWTTSETSKSIYDPCPAGWRVPDGGSNGIWSRSCGLTDDLVYPYDDINEGMNFFGKFGNVSTIWYPAAGARDRSCGSLYFVGSFGLYWSASSNGSSAYDLIFNGSGYVGPSYGNDRASGQSVRCLKSSTK